jgi:hypothetical protein
VYRPGYEVRAILARGWRQLHGVSLSIIERVC